MRYGFDWDPDKAERNLSKHQVSFEEAMTVFSDPLALSLIDRDQDEEERWITLGQSSEGKLVLVVHTYAEVSPEQAYIRIISARRPTRRERRQYEDGTT